MAEYTFPSNVAPDGPLAEQLRRLGDLYGPAQVAVAAGDVAREDRIPLGGRTGIIDHPTFEAELVERHDTDVAFGSRAPLLSYVAAVIAAASTFGEQMHLSFDALDVRGAIRELRDACQIVLDSETV